METCTYNDYCNYVADEIVKKIQNYDNNNNIRSILKTYILNEYSWESMFNKLYNCISIYETNNCNN